MERERAPVAGVIRARLVNHATAEGRGGLSRGPVVSAAARSPPHPFFLGFTTLPLTIADVIFECVPCPLPLLKLFFSRFFLPSPEDCVRVVETNGYGRQ